MYYKIGYNVIWNVSRRLLLTSRWPLARGSALRRNLFISKLFYLRYNRPTINVSDWYRCLPSVPTYHEAAPPNAVCREEDASVAKYGASVLTQMGLANN